MSNDNLITVTYQDRVAVVTLNRPDKLNALNADLYYLLGERLREIDSREDIFITVLTGKGRFFSAYVIHSPALDIPQDIPKRKLYKVYHV
jgi:peroxisomal 3,2-trans-enoyl-CoA isomerase